MEFDLHIEGITVRVLREDCFVDGPTLIFLHDSLGCIELWKDFPKKLGEASQCNVLIYDRQGYGKSSPFSLARANNYMELEADFLNKLIEKCEITNAVLFGHSDGGSIALITAAKYPTKISGVITEGAHVFVEEITLSGIKQATEAYRTTILKQKLEKYHGDKTEAMFWAWAGTWQTDDYKSWNIEFFLPLIQCPSLIIQGEDDEYGSIKQVDAIVNQVKGFSEKWMIPAIGHTPHKESPEETLYNSVAFIKSITMLV